MKQVLQNSSSYGWGATSEITLTSAQDELKFWLEDPNIDKVQFVKKSSTRL